MPHQRRCRINGALYDRAYNGRSSRWHQAALIQKAGCITAAGLTRDVTFEPVDGPINDPIDDGYGRSTEAARILAR